MRASSPFQPTEKAVVGVTLTKQGARMPLSKELRILGKVISSKDKT